MNAIKVLSPGLLSTIQDNGRKHFRKYGVPVSGVMDAYSAGLANMLLGNPKETAVLEITLQGPTLQFNCATGIALVGADLSPRINGMPIDRNKVIEIKRGDQLSFGKLITGSRCYLAIKDGFQFEKVFGSCSYYPGIADNILKSGMLIKIQEQVIYTAFNATVKIDDHHFSSPIISVQKGPEFEWLEKRKQDLLFEKDFKVSTRNNRMGYQLEGSLIKNGRPFDMLTAVTLPGTVQLTPAGNPIVLMRDCQTTGGYPRILQLTEEGINQLAQKKTNDLIRFQLR